MKNYKFKMKPAGNKSVYFLLYKDTHEMVPIAFSSLANVMSYVMTNISTRPVSTVQYARNDPELKKFGYPLTDLEWIDYLKSYRIKWKKRMNLDKDIPEDIRYPVTRAEGVVHLATREDGFIGMDINPHTEPGKRGLDFSNVGYPDVPPEYKIRNCSVK